MMQSRSKLSEKLSDKSFTVLILDGRAGKKIIGNGFILSLAYVFVPLDFKSLI
jgi:hypothetical protein